MVAIREIQLQRAYLLHSRPYRDQSLLVNLLTEQLGHVSAVVYIGKSKKSNKKGLLQPFASLLIELKGQGDLKTLSRLEHADKSLQLSGNFLFSGFYLNELMVRLLPENIGLDSLFSLYEQSLDNLLNQHKLESTLRQFEFRLLQEIGFSLDFSNIEESKGQYQITPNDANAFDQIDANSSVDEYYYIAGKGFVEANYPLNSPRYLRQHLIAIGDGNLQQADVLFTCKRLMRQVLKSYLGSKPLNSRKLFSNRFAK